MIFFSDFGATAGVGYMGFEGLTEQSASGTSWVDVASGTFTADQFTPSNDYLGFWSVSNNISSSVTSVRARVTLAGTDIFTIDSTLFGSEFTSPVDYFVSGGIFRHQPGASPASAAYKIQVSRGSNSATFKGKDAHLTLLKMGPNDAYAESIARQTFADPADKTASTVASITFSSPSSRNYLVLCSCIVDMTNFSTTRLGLELTDGTTTTGEVNYYIVNTADRLPVFIILPLSSVNGSKTVNLKFRQSGAGNGPVAISEIRMAALDETRFANVYKTTLGSNNGGTNTSYTSALSQSPSVAAGNHLTLASWSMYGSSATISVQTEYDDGGTIVNEFIREPIVANTGYGGMATRLATYGAGTQAQAIKRISETSSTTATIAASAAIVTLDLTGL